MVLWFWASSALTASSNLGALFGVLVAGFVLLATAGGYSPANALYLTFLDAAGAAFTNPRLSAPEKVGPVHAHL